MKPRLTTLPLTLAAVLTSCAAEPAATPATSGSTADTADASSAAPSTGQPTSGASTSEASTGTTGGAVTTEGAQSSSSAGVTGDTGSTGAASTGEASTGEASSGDSSSGASSTGADGLLGAAALDAMQALEAAVAGVTYPSESDYPWVVVGFADAAPVTEANVKAVIAAVYVPHEGQTGLADRTIELRTADQLFDPLTVPKDWWEDDHKQVAAQYTEIRAVLADKLVDVQVFRLGELQGNMLQGAVDVYVLGATADGDVVGMWTVSVET